jgi:HSP20 family protein
MTTTLTHWRPFAEIEDLRRRMEHMFEEIGDGRSREWSLAIDVIDRGDRYTVRADIPGMKAEDVTIEVEDGVLTISAEHEEATDDKQANYVRRERRYGSFSRSLILPEEVSADQIEATCHDGVLEVSFPKPKEAHEKVTITPKAT